MPAPDALDPCPAPPLAPRRRVGLMLVALALLTPLWPGACPEGKAPAPEVPAKVDDQEPPTARWGEVEAYRADREARRDPSDGGGKGRRVLAEGEAPEVRVGQLAQFVLEYEAGAEGVAVGGTLFFMPEPFWGWSQPQDIDPHAPGYTRVSTEVEGVALRTRAFPSMLAIEVLAAPLSEGDVVRVEYGAGEVGARVDQHADRGAHLWFAVDGDGDGYRQVVLESPTVDVRPGPVARAVVFLPSVARPQESVRASVALLDVGGNLCWDATGSVEFAERPAELGLPARIDLIPSDAGAKTVQLAAPARGVVRLEVSVDVAGTRTRATSNPMLVSEDAPRIFWADLHGHSNLSDGSGMPGDYFRYARDAAGLDVVSLTDHDHFGVVALDEHPDLWDEIERITADYNNPGRFVTLLGYEWTSWIHGHRHVLYFGDMGKVISSVDEATDDPRELWNALTGMSALTFAHHTAGQPIQTNWTFAPHPSLEPLVEIMSVHGSSEARDAPRVVRGATSGYFVRDALQRGYRLGFVGSGDSHDGHPGLAHLDPIYGYRPATPARPAQMGTGGLTAIYAKDLNRDSLFAALRERRVYATSGPRILLRTDLEGHPAGSVVAAASLGESAKLGFDILGTAELSTIELIRSGNVETRITPQNETELSGKLPIPSLVPGEYVYLRVVQSDGGVAVSSPFFFD